ncbi:40S ribosomal protein S19a-like [Teleopsis dalmanni]|uniref:40S ribosomal protein S19a-like n=1 Tax=Teleopsis dalmanni TaxID=139649 RepID=UPI0018CD9149|nr:40S ribosomal protein S19a-like [Teleopsis dalmanni]XP_037961213.1 40S ribosomal protein S19a-like [Teleopsis dalmanni]
MGKKRYTVSKAVSVLMTDVDQHAVTSSLAVMLKKNGKVKVPTDIEFFKTGMFKEIGPDDADWFYARCASILRHLYKRRPLGVGRLCKIYGGRLRRGNRPGRFCKASGGVMRRALKALEDGKMVIRKPNGSRVLTPTLQRDMDRLAQVIIKIDREVLALQQKRKKIRKPVSNRMYKIKIRNT